MGDGPGRSAEFAGGGRTLMLARRKILLGVSGGIAAYKSAELARLLVQAGAEVTAVMTANACRFLAPLTLRTLTGRPVATELFTDPTTPLPHISLAQWAEALVIAPATAERLSAAATGRADDLLSAILLDTAAPVLWAPAMNTRMWEHPITQEHARKLSGLGHHFVGPEQGDLACGETGKGRLAKVEDIVEALCQMLAPSDLAGKRVLITAGPTREAVDAIRFLTNRSTGKMGYALAAAAARRGARVTLVSGPVQLPCPAGVTRVSVTTALEMHERTLDLFPKTDIVIATAAVADFRPGEPSSEKLKKNAFPEAIRLLSNPDILMEMGQRKEHQILVGFAAETQNLIENAKAKRAAKHCDLLVANPAAGADDAFGADCSRAYVVDRQDQVTELPRLNKLELANLILDRIAALAAGPTQGSR